MIPDKNKAFAKRLLRRLDKLDNDSLQAYLSRIIEEQGFLESVFNTIHEAIIVIDGDFKIAFANSACKPMLGIGLEDIGQSIEKFFRQFPWQDYVGKDAKLPSASRREIEVFYPVHRFLSFYIMPIARQGGKKDAPLATLIFQDVTESVQNAEINLETQKIKAITQLAAGVAHELGNPLNSLGIHLQLTKRTLRKLPDSSEKEQLMSFIDTTEQEVRRLDTIVKNFLSAIRPAPINSVLLDMPKLIADAAGFMAEELKNHGISLEVSIQPNLPVVFGDPDQLTQAFFNIIKNAMQAMQDKGAIYISCNADDVYVNVKFIDTGKGIKEEEMPKLLDPYFTTKSSGTGLGLLIVDRIVRAHGGTLAIESEPGQGSAVTISLPLYVRQTRLLQN